MTEGKLYFAHSRKEYGTLQEKHILNTIHRKFSACKIFNPGSKVNQRNFNRVLTPGLSVREYMKPFFDVIDGCVMLLFSTLPNDNIGKGTYEEILYAFTKELPVYRVKLPDLFTKITSDMVIRLHENSGKSGWAENYGMVLIKEDEK